MDSIMFHFTHGITDFVRVNIGYSIYLTKLHFSQIFFYKTQKLHKYFYLHMTILILEKKKGKFVT